MKHLQISILTGILLVVSACKSQESSIVAAGAQLTLVAEDYEFTEGPAVNAQGDVYFTDQPNDRILKWSAADNSVSTFMQPAGRANGLYFAQNGDLLAAADEKFSLWRIDSNKNITVITDAFEEKKLNGPNDIWEDDKGGIYFTDPYYQRPYWKRTERELEKQQVYYINPKTGEIKVVIDNFVQPNGIIGTPDGKMLYVADIGDKKTYSFKIEKDGTLSDRKLFAEMGSDGMTLDNQGNVYLTGDGVTVFDKNGQKILHIPVPEKWTANVTFGGPGQNILFITAMDSVYTLAMKVHGIR
ncbi:MAG: SMP-30/gluconolactonase/LRE family protein [Maribacter sp.]|nr:SMP-30/gluconolactonase/LRE family protein [Maribacter sp.]